jgi:hypothetical protein
MSIISLSVDSAVRLYRDDVPSVVSPATGRIWMDRNLGALRVAQSTTDADALGWLYQWGRLTDGHQLRTSSTTGTLSAASNPGNNLFITATVNPFDWRSPAQDGSAWQGVNGLNNPCPPGYRIPTNGEFGSELSALPSQTVSSLFDSFLKLTAGGERSEGGGITNIGSHMYYWTSDTNTLSGWRQGNALLIIGSAGNFSGSQSIAKGCSCRCIKN